MDRLSVSCQVTSCSCRPAHHIDWRVIGTGRSSPSTTSLPNKRRIPEGSSESAKGRRRCGSCAPRTVETRRARHRCSSSSHTSFTYPPAREGRLSTSHLLVRRRTPTSLVGAWTSQHASCVTATTRCPPSPARSDTHGIRILQGILPQPCSASRPIPAMGTVGPSTWVVTCTRHPPCGCGGLHMPLERGPPDSVIEPMTRNPNRL